MAEILHQLIGSFSLIFIGFHTSQVVQDFSHQQYDWMSMDSYQSLIISVVGFKDQYVYPGTVSQGPIFLPPVAVNLVNQQTGNRSLNLMDS